MTITVIDYGLSNLLSVRRAFEHFGAEVEITGDAQAVAGAKALVLPGVGAFRDGMDGLTRLGLTDPIRAAAASGTPLLGICLGMQMLFEESDEFGRHAGLGLIPGRVVKIPSEAADGTAQRVPNIGWRPLYPAGSPGAGTQGFAGAPASFADSALSGLQVGEECYFVHSYEARPAFAADRLADAIYGGRRICAAARRANVLGTQFHPEKSGPVGLSIIEAWLHGAESRQ